MRRGDFMPAALILNRLSFEYPNGKSIFREISLSLESGITALVGPNGIGKSTFAKVLVGKLEPTEGTLHRREDVVHLSQLESPPAQTAMEYLESHGKDEGDLQQMPRGWFDDVNLGLSCQNLSGGQWMKVRLAAHWGSGFLILDEPSNDLDQVSKARLVQFLKQHRHGILLISHDRELLELCDQVLEFSNQGLEKFGLSWNEYLESRSRERSRLEEELQQAKIERQRVGQSRQQALDRQNKRNRRGKRQAERGGMPKILLGGMKRRAQATTGRVDQETSEKADTAVRVAFEKFSAQKVEPVMYLKIAEFEPVKGKTIACATDFNIRFADWLFRPNLSFTLRGDSRLLIRGKNGSGKSTLFRILMGEEWDRDGEQAAVPEQRGDLQCASVRTLYLDQKLARLDPKLTILEYLQKGADLPETELRNELAMFLFHGDQVHQKIESLSGGERLRVALAEGFIGRPAPELIVLDEPTNNLDLFNAGFLEGLIRAYRGAVLMASHDRFFVENCAMSSSIDLVG